MMHAYRCSLLMQPFRTDTHGVGIAAPVIYSCLANLCVVGTACAVVSLCHGVRIAGTAAFIILMGYSSIHLAYFAAVAYLHSVVVGDVEYPAVLLVCVSSLGYLPAALLLAVLGVCRADYTILVLTAFSAAFVARNTVQRIEGLSHARAVLYTILVIVSEYAAVHFYKNTIFCNFAR